MPVPVDKNPPLYIQIPARQGLVNRYDAELRVKNPSIDLSVTSPTKVDAETASGQIYYALLYFYSQLQNMDVLFAVGDALDRLGAQDGVLRAGRVDDIYRIAILNARNQRNTSTESGLLAAVETQFAERVFDLGFSIDSNLNVSVYVVAKGAGEDTSASAPGTPLSAFITEITNYMRRDDVGPYGYVFSAVAPTHTQYYVKANVTYDQNISTATQVKADVKKAFQDFADTQIGFNIRPITHYNFLAALTDIPAIESATITRLTTDSTNQTEVTTISSTPSERISYWTDIQDADITVS